MQQENSQGRLVNTGHYVGLKFENGWIFLHVLETEQIELKPWILLNENEDRAEIAPQTAGSDDDEFSDVVGRQMLEPQDNEQDVVFQLLFGVAPSRVQLYPQFGRNSTPNLVGGAEPDTPQTPITGYDSPYNNPTQQGEVFTVNGMDDLAIQAYNPMDEPVEARASVHVNKFRYAVVDDVSTMAQFIQGTKPFRDHPMGLGAQSNDQLKAPGWMQDKFGDYIMSTREILQEAETLQNQANTPSGDTGDVIPSPSDN